MQDDELIGFADFLEHAYAVDNAERLELLHVVAQYNAAASRVVRFTIAELALRRVVASGHGAEAWPLALKLGLHLPNDTPTAPDSTLVPYCLAYIAHGVELAVLTPVLTDALAHRTQKGHRFSQLRVLALLAWQQVRLHDTTAAGKTLAQAVDLARATGYGRVLLDIPNLAPLLPSIKAAALPALPPADALTDQELRVLKLLAANCTYEQIATALVISLNTVRTHVRNAYRKLHAKRRDQAIDAARSQGLLAADNEVIRMSSLK